MTITAYKNKSINIKLIEMHLIQCNNSCAQKATMISSECTQVPISHASANAEIIT
jgi:hypothetical protein